MTRYIFIIIIYLIVFNLFSCGSKKEVPADNGQINSLYQKYSKYRFKYKYPDESYSRQLFFSPGKPIDTIIYTIFTPSLNKDILTIDYKVKNTGASKITFDLSQSFLYFDKKEFYPHKNIEAISIDAHKEYSGQFVFKINPVSHFPVKLFFIFSEKPLNIDCFLIDDFIKT
ncbi:MAG: hypothetical protein OEZ36_03875 [Spirochaetota bacterium]|nr:hypothetical protein [Spirochaetota bacterium]